MNRSQITAGLSELLEQYLAKSSERWAKEVRIGAPTECRVDYMSIRCVDGAFARIGDVETAILSCYEVKSCMADFKSGNGLNDLGEVNFIVCPDELRRELISRSIICSSAWSFAIPCPISCMSFAENIEYSGEVEEWRLQFFGTKPFATSRKIPIAQAMWAILCAQKPEATHHPS